MVRVLVVVGGVERERPLRVLHQAPVLGDLRRVVRAADLVVEEFAPEVAEPALQLGRGLEELARTVEGPDAIRQLAEHLREPVGTVLAVDLVVVGHRALGRGTLPPHGVTPRSR